MLIEKADILIPRSSVDMCKWAVIACDQHTSEEEYWNKLQDFVGEDPSTLHLMLPECFLGRGDFTDEINKTMRRYLDCGVFEEYKDSYIFVQRTLADGSTRNGLVCAINLDEYDYSASSSSSIRATEATVEERLPARVKIRNGACLEMPHVIVFCEEEIPVIKKELLYDFDLNMGGGHIKGWLCDADVSSISRLAIGDGNHSLATAKKCGDHKALVEVVNIHDEGVVFHPIHRVMFNTDTSFLESNILEFSDVKTCEQFCQEYVKSHGGYVDYIHGSSTAISLAQKDGCVAALLPAFDKNQLFNDVFNLGPYEKKSFSIGKSEDKRYYLECRKINV